MRSRYEGRPRKASTPDYDSVIAAVTTTTDKKLTPDRLLQVINDFVLRYNLPVARVVHPKQIRSPFFGHLYVALVGPLPSGASLHPKSVGDEIRSLEVIIASLSRGSQPTLNAAGILRGDEDAIFDLVQVFTHVEEAKNEKDNAGEKNSESNDLVSSTNLVVDHRSSSGQLPSSFSDGISCKGNVIENKDKDGQEVESEHSFLRFVVKELDILDAPMVTKRQLKKKYEQYLKFEAKSVASALRRRTHSEIALKEARRRRRMLSKLVTKETELGERLNYVRRQRQDELVDQRRLRERRMHAAYVKRRRNEAAAALRRTNLKQKTNGDYKVLTELCDENLLVRKTRLLAYLQDEKEQQQAESAGVRLRNEAVGKYNEDQLAMLAGTLQHEAASLSVQEQAQSKLVEDLKRDCKIERVRRNRKLEDKVAQRHQRDALGREVDAHRLKEDLWRMS